MAKIKVNKKLPEYPPNHKLGMEVPEGGSDCAKCEYWKNDLCSNSYFIKWNGTGEIPTKPEKYCCDFFETK